MDHTTIIKQFFTCDLFAVFTMSVHEIFKKLERFLGGNFSELRLDLV